LNTKEEEEETRKFVWNIFQLTRNSNSQKPLGHGSPKYPLPMSGVLEIAYKSVAGVSGGFGPNGWRELPPKANNI